jgi:hypothetical protein
MQDTIEITIGDIIHTAAAWYNGMNSALYSFVSTETIHSLELKAEMLDTLESEIDDIPDTENGGAYDLEDELKELRYLREFIGTAPIGVSLSTAIVNGAGRFVAIASGK